jgi:hypothetical protein
VQRVAVEDLWNQLRGVRDPIVDPRAPNISRGEFVPVTLEEFLESRICQFDAAVPIKNDNP